MPFAELPESCVRLWWRSNLPSDDLALLRKSPQKPLIVLLHPVLLASHHLDAQFNCPFLHDHYHMIAFDWIGCGRTECPTYLTLEHLARHDTWVDAALLAQFAHALQLPPFHIFAVQGNSNETALRFSMLFPRQCLSLTLCSTSHPSSSPEWVSEAYSSLIRAWITAQDLQSFEEAIGGLAYLEWGENGITEEELDDIVEYWQQHYNPSRCTRMLSATAVLQTRVPLRPDEIALVKHPVTIIMGNSSEVHPLAIARDLKKQLVNVPNGAQLGVVPGCHNNASVSRRFAPVTNKHFASFLATLPPFQGSSGCTIEDIDMRRALGVTAELANDPSMNQRNPLSAWSFSRTPPEAHKMIWETLLPVWTKIAEQGITFLRSDGNVIRKYSERHDDACFGEVGS